MYTYIKKSVRGNYLVLEEMLDPELYDNIGQTYSDYLNDRWVLLSDAQVAFKEDHPYSSVRDVFYMELPVQYERTVEDVRRDLIRNIEQYDTSKNVNSFLVNDSITAWFTVQERLNYKQSIEAAKLLGIETLSFYIGDMKLDIAPEMAEQMLAMIQLYADQCFLVTKQHLLNANALETIEEVESYNYKDGYPERLNFQMGGNESDVENGETPEQE